MPAIPEYVERTSPNGTMASPNARGIRVDDSGAQALERIGQTGMQVAGRMQSIAKQQEADDAQAWIAKTMADTRLQWTKHALETRETAQAGAAGYTPALLKEFDEFAGKTLEGAPTPKAKAQLSEHLNQFRAGLGVDALQWEAGQRRAARIDTLSQAVGNAATVVQGDPRQYDGALSEQLLAIESLQLQPEDKLKLQEKARQDLSTAAVLGQIRQDPHAALRDLQGATPVDASSPQAAIVSAAKKQGVDPTLALAVAKLESNFDPKAKNPISAAHGLYQAMPATAQQYGLPDNADTPAQAAFGATFLRDTQASLTKSLGHKPEPWETYMGHVFGATGGAAILKAPDGEPVGQALDRVAPGHGVQMAEANGLAGMSVGQAKSKWQSMTAKAMDSVSGIAQSADREPTAPSTSQNTAIDSLTLPERLRLRSAAETEVNRQQATARVALEETVHDAQSAYQNGEPYANPPNIDAFAAAYGPAEGGRRYAEFRRTQQLGDDIQSVKNLSFSEQNDLIARRAPQGGEGAADDNRRYQMLLEAVGQQRKLFFEDPAKYAVTNAPKVNAAYTALTAAMANPITSAGGNDALKFLTAQYVTATRAEQQRIAGGTPGFQPALVPESYVDYIAQQFQSQGQGGQNAANQVQQLADQWGSAWPDLYAQAGKKLPPAALVIGAGMEQGPAMLLAEAAKLKPEQLTEGLSPTTGSQVKQALADSFAEFGATTANQVGGVRTFNTFYGEAEKLALMYVQQGQKPAAAAQKAYADVIGAKYSFQNTYRVPVTQDVAHVTRGADLELSNLDPAGLRLPATPGMTPEMVSAEYTSRLKHDGVWVTAPDESGLVLFAAGAAVLDAQGRPLTRTWDQLQKRSRSTPGFFGRLFGVGAPPPTTATAP